MDLRLHPLHPRYHATTQALIHSAAPERDECASAWSRTPCEPTTDGAIRRDYVAIDANNPATAIGYGAIWPQREQQFRMDLIVARARRRQGVGAALLQTLVAQLEAQRATAVQARTRSDRQEALTFLRNHGFIETNRMTHLRLFVAQVPTPDHTELTARLNVLGITIVTLEQEQAQTPDWPGRIQELIRATMPGRVANPYQGGGETELFSVEDARHTWESYRPLRPDAFFLARKRECYVGLSYLGREGAAGPLVQGDTAVHFEWRRHGIASLLKLHTIAYAQQFGYAEILTTTASPGMLALNERLGFRQEWAEVRLVRRIANL